MSRDLRLAFVGKGGSGKSVIAGTAARLLARQGARVLALDFDTMPGLAYTIGLDHAQNTGLPEELGVRRKKKGWGLRRRVSAATLVQRHAIEAPDGIRFLQLGKLPNGVKPGSTVAFRHVAETFRRRGWSIVGDLAAGTRQSFFGWADFASVVIVVVEPSKSSLVSARRLRGLGDAVPQAVIGVVLSKVRPDTPVDDMVRETDLPLWGIVPYDKNVNAAEREGLALIDVAPESAAVEAVAKIVQTLQSAAREDT